MKWIDKLQERWQVASPMQVLIILIVFACTGFTVAYIRRPLLSYYFVDGEIPLWVTISYYILILPVYNLFLLFYGFVFGQFRFFWNFEKKFFRRITSIFNKKP
jgi:hypothetical protein